MPSSQERPSLPQTSSPIVNPLVTAGLVPVGILVTPSHDAAVAKKHTKRTTGARELIANEYREWLQKEERRKKE